MPFGSLQRWTVFFLHLVLFLPPGSYFYPASQPFRSHAHDLIILHFTSSSFFFFFSESSSLILLVPPATGKKEARSPASYSIPTPAPRWSFIGRSPVTSRQTCPKWRYEISFALRDFLFSASTRRSEVNKTNGQTESLPLQLLFGNTRTRRTTRETAKRRSCFHSERSEATVRSA